MKDSRLGNNISQYANGTPCPDEEEPGAPAGSIRLSFVTLPAAARGLRRELPRGDVSRD